MWCLISHPPNFIAGHPTCVRNCLDRLPPWVQWRPYLQRDEPLEVQAGSLGQDGEYGPLAACNSSKRCRMSVP